MARKERFSPLKGSMGHIIKLHERRDSKFMSSLLKLWVKVVQEPLTAYPPAKIDTIIGEKRRAKMEITIGWYAYKSGMAGSHRRMQPRLQTFFTRAEKKMKRRRKASAIRGVAAKPIIIKVGHR